METIYDQIPFFSAPTPQWEGWNQLLDAARCCDQNAQYQVDVQPIWWLETDNGTGYWEAVSHASLTPLAVEPGTRLMKAQFGVIEEVSVSTTPPTRGCGFPEILMNIPKGWQECQEVPATNSQTAPPSMYVDGNGCESSVKTQWAVIKTVSGESKEGLETPDANRIEIDGIRFASDGERVITRTIPSYFSHWVPKAHAQGDDICFYCGTSNGPNGELRQGHDCWSCGSN